MQRNSYPATAFIATLVTMVATGCFNTELPERFQADSALLDTGGGEDTDSSKDTSSDTGTGSDTDTGPGSDTNTGNNTGNDTGPAFDTDKDSTWHSAPTGIIKCANHTTLFTCPTGDPDCKYDTDSNPSSEPDTETDTNGEVYNYDSQYFCGQDAHYRDLYAPGVFGYSDRFNPFSNTSDADSSNDSDTIIEDRHTGMMWYRYLVSQENLADARTTCDTSSHGGYTDWKLPTYHQFATLMNYGDEEGPMIDTDFGNVPEGAKFWTSSEFETRQYIIYPNEGKLEYDWSLGATPRYVMCVRNAVSYSHSSPTNRYDDSNADYFIDNATGLYWQTQIGDSLHWPQALTYCQESNVGGTTDWRLPNVNELRGLIDLTKESAPATIIPANAGDDALWYWSSTPAVYATNGVMVVFFNNGAVQWASMDGWNPTALPNPSARCVRGNP